MEPIECPTCYQEPEIDDVDGVLCFAEHDDLDGQRCPSSGEQVPDA